MRRSGLNMPRVNFLRVIQLALLALILGATAYGVSEAATAREIDVSVDEAIKRFRKEVKGSGEFLKVAKGVLVFPKVVKAGFVVGGEYGEGALRINGRTVDYYSTAAASFGLQVGAQAKTVILVFMQQAALDKFRNSEGWKVGVDGSVAVIDVGGGGSVDTNTIKDPIVGFIFDNKGLMLNLTLEGSKFTKLNKKE